MNAQTEKPSCVVLMATCNGGDYLGEQIRCLKSQTAVSVTLTISDDHSSDATHSRIEEWRRQLPIEMVPRDKDANSNANKNFLSLLARADIGPAAFVAFSDQDDIWDSDKLARAIERLDVCGADVYSSDVIAWWPDGRKKLIKKSYPQRRYDHLYGSPGPGCTFVLRRGAFLRIQQWVKENYHVLSTLWIHDWSIYCYARQAGLKWIIDDAPKMLYRQHSSNAMGANAGLGAILQRFSKILNDEYRYNIVTLAELTHAFPACVKALRRLSFFDRLWLISRAQEFRRSRMEVLVLQFIFLIMPKGHLCTAPMARDGVCYQESM